MENQSQKILISSAHRLKISLPSLLLFIGLSYGGTHTRAEEMPSSERSLEKAATLQQEAAELRREAEAFWAEQQQICYRKFLVNDCRNEAHEKYLGMIHQSRKMDSEGKAMERQIKAEEKEQERQNQKIEAEKEAAELPGRQAIREAEDKAKAAEQARKLAEKEQQARKGAEKAAKRRAKQERKQAKHAERVAEKIEKHETAESQKTAPDAVAPPPPPSQP